MSEVIDESLKGFLRVCGQGSVICKQHLPEEDLADFGLGTQTGQVEEAPITPSVDVDAVSTLVKGALQQEREEDAKERRSKDTSLFHAAENGKEF